MITEATILNDSPCTQEAKYGRGGRKGCLEGTHGTVPNEIKLWARDFNESPAHWLNGLARTGKSTVVERLFVDGPLAASFSHLRDSEDRNNLRFAFPTLAVQLAPKYTELRSIAVPTIRSNPGVPYRHLCKQVDELIAQPLATKSVISTVIVIDTLDECKDEERMSGSHPLPGNMCPGSRKSSTSLPAVQIHAPGKGFTFRCW